MKSLVYAFLIASTFKMRKHLRFRYCNIVNLFRISIAVLKNEPPDEGLKKR
jgi:hypothetical protein